MKLTEVMFLAQENNNNTKLLVAGIKLKTLQLAGCLAMCGNTHMHMHASILTL